MSNDFSERLKQQADRLENIMSALKDGKLKASDVDMNDIYELEANISKYEEILKQE
jgi:hypothetical protein